LPSFTKIIVKLLPAPESKSTFLLLCSGIAEAARLVAAILAHHTPCTLEYMDQTALRIVSSKLPFPLPDETKALLLLELDGDKETLSLASSRLTAFLAKQEGINEIREATSSAEAEQLWVARRAVSPSSFSLRPHKISEDVVVPRNRIPDLVAKAEHLSKEHDLTIFTFGHAGDGNIHVNIMLDRNNPREIENAKLAKNTLFNEVLRLGGTLSGEHGVGITKADYLSMEIDEQTLELMRRVKNLFDPKNILNPGKIFPSRPDGKKHLTSK